MSDGTSLLDNIATSVSIPAASSRALNAIRSIETSRFHLAARRRRRVAARGARAASGEAADHRFPQQFIACQPGKPDYHIPARHARKRLRRRKECGD